ncbi:MAG TPA: AMMECR1 domain-containing protein [Candidatus Angelobacter sp.]|nr:AMMECR1 domain-containing protein [Candidatus Angelobacter sp.]
MRRDLSSILSSLPESFQQERRELLSLLLQDGILHRTPERPIVSRDGVTARWMLNSLGVTLSSRGAELAGRCLLQLLKNFDGRQLAAFGLIGVPVLQSCILQSAGKYHGLLVRKEAKPYGSRRIIEGAIDLNEPVILVDDSISSGTTFTEALERLESAGLRVEGIVCLVRFGWLSGYSSIQERGYHVEALFDIHDDLMASMEGEVKPIANPSKVLPRFEWSAERAPEGLHPTELARIVLNEYLSTGKLLRPAARLDRDYDSSGGAWVSLRSKSNIHLRYARDGFWHLPDELHSDQHRSSVAKDIAHAALLTAQLLPKGKAALDQLASSHIAVTLFSALEECPLSQLDNDRYGIVVRSRERISLMGGALPRMPGIGNEFQQLQHARIRNGKLLAIEPYTIYRHGVTKLVEPGVQWQLTGTPKPAEVNPCEDQKTCSAIAERARDIALAHLLKRPEITAPLPDNALPQDVHSIFVTIYIWGQLQGCMGNAIASLDKDLRALVLAALADERFNKVEASVPGAIAVSVSLLSNAITLGEFLPDEVVRRCIHGKQALQVYQKERQGILLPFLAAMHDLSPVNYALEVIDKAGITRPPYQWQRFDCSTWLADDNGTGLMEGAFKRGDQDSTPQKPAPAGSEDMLSNLADLFSSYMIKHQKADGSFYESYEPFRNRLHEGLIPPRAAHGAWVVARAANVLEKLELRQAADKAVDFLLKNMRVGEFGTWLEFSGHTPSVSEIAFLVLALCEFPKGNYRRKLVRSLAETLWASIDRHGRIATHRNTKEVSEVHQDYAPGQVLLALAAAAASGLTEINQFSLNSSFRYYRHRFRYNRDFGQVSWLMQAFSRWWQIQPDPEFANLVFEIGDWVLEFQSEKDGSFLTGHQSDTPGFTSAVYLEGLGAAAGISKDAKYRAACMRGMQFLNRLTIQPGHAPVLPNSDLAIGGLRQSLYTSFVRLDFVQHALSSVLEQYALSSARDSLALTPMESAAAAVL